MLGIPLALIWVALVAVAAWVWVAEWVEVKEVAGEEDWVPLPPGYALPMMIATMIYDLLPRYDVNVAELVVEGVVEDIIMAVVVAAIMVPIYSSKGHVEVVVEELEAVVIVVGEWVLLLHLHSREEEELPVPVVVPIIYDLKNVTMGNMFPTSVVLLPKEEEEEDHHFRYHPWA